MGISRKFMTNKPKLVADRSIHFTPNVFWSFMVDLIIAEAPKI